MCRAAGMNASPAGAGEVGQNIVRASHSEDHNRWPEVPCTGDPHRAEPLSGQLGERTLQFVQAMPRHFAEECKRYMPSCRCSHSRIGRKMSGHPVLGVLQSG